MRKVTRCVFGLDYAKYTFEMAGLIVNSRKEEDGGKESYDLFKVLKGFMLKVKEDHSHALKTGWYLNGDV